MDNKKKKKEYGVDWQNEWAVKNKFLNENFERVHYKDFYRDLFPEGSFQKNNKSNEFKGNMIITNIKKRKKGEKERPYSPQRVCFDDFKKLDWIKKCEFPLIAPISFLGNTHKRKNAFELFAFVIDIDYVSIANLRNFKKQFCNKGTSVREFIPSYIVNSGKGIHVYYLLDKPIPMYENMYPMLSQLKRNMTGMLWNDFTSLSDDIDATNLFQGFRAVGGRSKLSSDWDEESLEDWRESLEDDDDDYKMNDNGQYYFPVLAFRVGVNKDGSTLRYSLEELNNHLYEDYQIDVEWKNTNYKRPQGVLPLEKAKKKYPNWTPDCERKGNKEKSKPKWRNKNGYATYEWFIRKIKSDAVQSGRYFSIMALASFGLKCGVSKEKIKEDALSLVEHLDSLTDVTSTSVDHFTVSDVEDALRDLFKNPERSQMSTRDWMESHTHIPMPPSHRIKARRLPQEYHLKLCRQNGEFKWGEKYWLDYRHDLTQEDRVKGGKVNKQKIVTDWKKYHPNGTKAQCIRDTGLSKPTVYKWW